MCNLYLWHITSQINHDLSAYSHVWLVAIVSDSATCASVLFCLPLLLSVSLPNLYPLLSPHTLSPSLLLPFSLFITFLSFLHTHTHAHNTRLHIFIHISSYIIAVCVHIIVFLNHSRVSCIVMTFYLWMLQYVC